MKSRGVTLEGVAVFDMTLSAEQRMLRDSSRQFLAQRVTSERRREVAESGSGFDADLWSDIAKQGWPAMHIPEERGGAGFSFVETTILMEELGRVLAPIPFLASKVLATEMLLLSEASAVADRLLSEIATGASVVTTAVTGPDGRWSNPPEIHAREISTGFVLDGPAAYVPFGHVASTAIVAGLVNGSVGLFAVDLGGSGVEIEPQPTLDLTQPLVRLELNQAEGDPINLHAASAIEASRLAGKAALAAELVGITERILEMAVEYAKARKQFGRAIGSFQAVKHACADILVDLEGARSLAYYAARALAEGADDARQLVLAAKAAAGEAAFKAAGTNIQIHGGIGFTWEHDAHYYFKRAKASSLIFGTSAEDRADLARELKL